MAAKKSNTHPSKGGSYPFQEKGGSRGKSKAPHNHGRDTRDARDAGAKDRLSSAGSYSPSPNNGDNDSDDTANPMNAMNAMNAMAPREQRPGGFRTLRGGM